MPVRVDLVGKGMRELLGDPGVAVFLHERADLVAAAAKATAPVETGDYMRSIHVEEHREASNRVVARVVAGTDHCFEVEARHGTLGRALDAARA